MYQLIQSSIFNWWTLSNACSADDFVFAISWYYNHLKHLKRISKRMSKTNCNTAGWKLPLSRNCLHQFILKGQQPIGELRTQSHMAFCWPIVITLSVSHWTSWAQDWPPSDYNRTESTASLFIYILDILEHLNSWVLRVLATQVTSESPALGWLAWFCITLGYYPWVSCLFTVQSIKNKELLTRTVISINFFSNLVYWSTEVVPVHNIIVSAIFPISNLKNMLNFKISTVTREDTSIEV